MQLSFNGSIDGQHTLADLRSFLDACTQLGMPHSALVSGKTKLLGSGPIKTLTADWDEHDSGSVIPTSAAPVPAPVIPPTPVTPAAQNLNQPTTPLTLDLNPPTTPLPAVK